MIAEITADDKVESYITGVLSGTITVGSLVRAAVERHVADLKKQDSQEFPYYFDKEAAEKKCQFFPKILRHSVGEWAGRPFHLEPWQAFMVWSIHGWKRLDGTRRFRKVYILVGRKNGKTQLMAGIAHQLAIADGEPGAQVFCSATKLEQAKVLYCEAERMVRQAPSLSKHAKLTTNNLAYPGTNSFIRPLGSDKPFDGLNPHAVVFDELHAWRQHHRAFFDTMVTGSGARRQPLLCVITTEGDGDSELWIAERDYAIDVVTGKIEDESVFAMLYCVDPEDDAFCETNWCKANPNLGVSVKIDDLRQKAKEAQHKPTARSQFLRYHLNRVVSNVEWGIDSQLWSIASQHEPKDWSNADCITAGVDIGGRDDLAAVAYCARFPDGYHDLPDGTQKPIFKYDFRVQSYLYPDSKRDLTQAPWYDWLRSGRLIKNEFVINEIKKKLILDAKDLEFAGIAYDQYNAQQLGEDLTAEGLRAIEFRQNFLMYNEPIREFLSLLSGGKIMHDGNPILAWAAKNLAIKKDSADRWMPCKKSSKDKIDPVVACFMAFRLAMLAPSRPKGNLFVF